MLVSGKNLLEEALKRNQKINKIIIPSDFKDKNLIFELEKLNITLEYKPKSVLRNLDKENSRGIILDIPEYNFFDLDSILKSEKGLIVMVDHIEDPHNLGAIIRTCEAAGVDGIIIPKDRNVKINSTVVKTSAGSIFNTKIVEVVNLKNVIEKLKKNSYWIVGSDMESEDYRSFDFSNINVCLVVGNEGFGMSKLIKESCDYLVKIPMKGEVNSLNVSVATGILLYKIIEYR